jgi:prepilin-type processing-associated H-X9-DG protein
MVLAATQRDLAMSTVQSEWYVQQRHAEQFNAAYQDGHNQQQVMLFFTVSDSRHIQGAALMTGPAVYHDEADSGKDAYCYHLSVEWYRTTELPIEFALKAATELLLPTPTTQPCQDMSPKTERVSKAALNSPLVTLYELWSGEKEPPVRKIF